MKSVLLPAEIVMLRSVFRRHPKLTQVRLFGSRAKGTHTERSDVDLALFGNLDHLEGQAVAAELDELPLPYKYDVQVFDLIRDIPLRDHIERIGISLYPDVAGIDGAGSQDSVSKIEARYMELVSGQQDLWTTLSTLPVQETRALITLGLSEENGNYKKMAARFHLGDQEYRRFMDFLKRHDCLVDFRPYCNLQVR
jgi:predicted nucleotidyltransferase